MSECLLNLAGPGPDTVDTIPGLGRRLKWRNPPGSGRVAMQQPLSQQRRVRLGREKLFHSQ